MPFSSIALKALRRAVLALTPPASATWRNAGGFRGFDEFFHQNVDHGGLERSGEIVFVLFDELRIFGYFVFQEVEERGFQAGEAVIEAVDVRFGEAEGLGVACRARRSMMGPPG